jgi:long-chain fatty acid transport protein
MKTSIALTKHPVAIATALFIASVSSAHAAFFQLAENGSSGLGQANAGAAAMAADATTVWFNPAGMTQLSGSQTAGAVHSINPSFEADNVSGAAVTAVPISGNNGGDAGESALVPNFYYTQALSGGMTFGIGINAPFGLATDYDSGWVGRYHALRSEIQALNINPSIAYQVNDQFSVGFGVNFEKLDATLSQAIDFATICTVGGASGACGAGAGYNPATNPNDGKATVTADDTAWGYNFGLLWKAGDATRVGFAYRSKMDFDLDGDVNISAPSNVPGPFLTGAGLVDSAVSSKVTLPATMSLSVVQVVSPTLTLAGDITRTNWSDLPELRINFDSTQPDSVVTLNLKDVSRYSFGGVYTLSDAWALRAGIALDQTPVPDASHRTPRLPDNDRKWYSIGASYKSSNSFSLDMAYVMIQVDDTEIHKTASGENQLRGSLDAEYTGSVNILSVQGNWKF